MRHGRGFALICLLNSVALVSWAGTASPGGQHTGVAPPYIQAELQAKTLRDINTVAIAIGAFEIDNKRYPGPTNGFVAVETLRADLQPMYVRELPVADAWGGGILYWSDGAKFRLVSKGADGKADRPYEDPKAGTATLNFDGDIVFDNGHFRKATETEGQ
jgi:hypothetical protein